MRKITLLIMTALVAVALPPATRAVGPVAAPLPQERAVEAVVMTGSQFGDWSAGPEFSAREPTQPMNSDCLDDEGDGLSHNCSEPSRIPNNPQVGADVDRLVGFRYEDGAFVEIPFQVDERFTRYISNLASNCTEAGPFCIGFGAYSGADPQLSYAFDRDTYRFTDGVCEAEMEPGDAPDPDPVVGLDDNDELSFMYRDTGPRAPTDTPLPEGITELRAVRLDDPSDPGTAPRYAYVGLAATTERTFGPADGYMRYVRDADSFRFLETSDNYGNAPRGPVCNDAGAVMKNDVPRRPKDTAWVLTPRYAFRYAARWTLKGVRVNPDPDATRPLDDPSEYGPPLVDQWKARAYAQTPESETPCCGFETEEGWTRSSVTLGERWGPVRVIRTTWGSDSGTNTVRNEILYPDVIVQETNLRVHPIPPLGGIFSYWDHTAGVVDRYYNPQVPEGVVVDGRNDEVIGTTYVAARPGGLEIRDDDDIPVIGPQGVSIGSPDGCLGECTDLDVTDPTLNAVGTLTWEQVSGPHGAMVFETGLGEITPGDPQSLATLPYYRDDSCFDDGTGSDPGPPRNREADRDPCWSADAGATAPYSSTPPFRQGLIGGHGVQVLFAAETDNLMLTVPATEIGATTRMVVLPGDPGNVGERYTYASDLPLTATVADVPALLGTSIEIGGDTSGRIGTIAELEATLTDPLGPVPNAPVSFSLQGFTHHATTDADGVARADALIREPAGEATLRVGYAGDGIARSPSQATSTFVVGKRETALTLDHEGTAKVNHAVRLVAELTDAQPVGGAELEFSFQDETYEATTDTDGIARTDPITVTGPAGEATAEVTFAGDTRRDAADAEQVIEVAKDDTDVAFTEDSDITARINQPVHLEASLVDTAGPIAGAVVWFGFQGRSYAATTDASGIASRDVITTGPVGDHDARVRFAGDGSREADAEAMTIAVSRDQSGLTFEPDSATSGTIGERSRFVAKLTDSSGPVVGAIVYFEVQGVEHDARTDERGIADIDVEIRGPAGETTVTVRSDGDATRAPTSATTGFTVAKRDSVISLTARKSRGSIVVKVRLTDGGTGLGVADAEVDISVDGTHVTTVTTNAEGRAKVSLEVSSPKGKVFGVAFAGNGTYGPSAAEGTFGKKGAKASS